MDPRAGLDWQQILHGEQSLKLHRPLEPQGELVGKTYIGDMADKGPGKHVMLKSGRTLSTLSGQLVAEMEEVWVLRGAGRFGGPRGLTTDRLPTLHETVPDASLDMHSVLNETASCPRTGYIKRLSHKTEKDKTSGK